MEGKTPVLMLVDVEPQKQQVSHADRADWHGVEEVAVCLNDFRAMMRQRTKTAVRFSWFFRMDPQIEQVYGSAVWAAKRYANLISDLSANGDEFGLHTHAWRWNQEREHWVEDLSDQAWVGECMRMSFAAFREAFGANCRMFRFGERWMNETTIALLEQLGARFDLTVEPGSDWQLNQPHSGELPDYQSAPQHPYRPAHSDFLRADESGQRAFWMIPLTTISAGWAWEPTQSVAARMNAMKAKCRSYAKGFVRMGGSSLATSCEGYLDQATPEEICGWAFNPARPEQVCEVNIYDGNRLLKRVAADDFRIGLLEAGKGDGRHSFWLPTPSRLLDGRPHTLHAKIAGDGFVLNGSPKTVFSGVVVKAAERRVMPYLNSPSAFFRQMINRLLNDEMPDHLAFVVRTDAGAELQGMTYLRQNLEYLLSHAMADRLDFVTPSQMEKYFPDMSQ